MNNYYYKKLNKRNDIYLFKIVSLSDKSVTIQININNFRSKDGSVIKRYTLKDDEGKEEDELGLIKYDIYLENIKEKYYNNDKLTKLEKYMLMLKLRKREELLEVSKGDKSMSEVYKKLDDLSKDKYYALLYDEEEKKAYENKCILEDAIEDAKENGYSSGYNSGYDSGKSDGISNEKINIAKNLLSMNMTLEDISKATGLSIEEINNLKDLTNMFLIFAEDEAKQRHVMTMKDWINATDDLLKFRRKRILNNGGSISHKEAIKKAENEYEKFRIKQDKEYISSMDEMYKRYLEESNK